jgi:hypothetical protein
MVGLEVYGVRGRRRCDIGEMKWWDWGTVWQYQTSKIPRAQNATANRFIRNEIVLHLRCN